MKILSNKNFFQPRARLLLQLGDKLIKNENIALLELIKNSYDADAKKVMVKLEKVNDKKIGKIEIIDDGEGMDLNIIENVWLEPGSDYKAQLFNQNIRSKKYKRLPIGEKGIGRFGVHKLGNISRLKSALYTLNGSLTDVVEEKIHKMQGDLFDNLISTDKVEIENFESILNKALLLTTISDNNTQPGNIYKTKESLAALLKSGEEKLEAELNQKQKLPEEVKAKAIPAIQKRYAELKAGLESEVKKFEKMTNTLINACINRELLAGKDEQLERLFKETIGVELNITPICDYAQDKTTLFRVLPGLLFKSEFKEFLIKSSAYIYLSDPILHVFGENYMLIFDFRFLYSVPEEKFAHMKPCFRLKHQYVSDIQVKLSSHVSRSGIYYVS